MSKSGIVVSTTNSYSGALGSGSTFQGSADDVRGFAELTVNLAGTESVAPGTLTFEFSPDGTNWDVSVPYTLAGPNSFVPLSLRVVLPYFRVKYENGGTALAGLRLTTVYHWQSAKNITRVINQPIDGNEPVENVRAFAGGRSPDGPYTNVPASGIVSAQSTNVPLIAGGSFSPASCISTTGFVAISVAVKSDVNSADMGVVISFFADSACTRLLKTSVFTYGSAPSGTAFQVPSIAGPYVKVEYLNGPIGQTSFELLTTLSVMSPPSDVLSVSETINGNTAAQITKSSIVGQQENGIYANSKLSNSGSQMVAIADRPSEVRGRVLVEARIFRTSLSATPTVIHTVTSGKTLYVTSFVISSINNANAIGEFRIRDGNIERMGYVTGEKATGASATIIGSSPPLPEPIPFTTSFNLIEITGDIQASVWILGYEEENA